MNATPFNGRRGRRAFLPTLLAAGLLVPPALADTTRPSYLEREDVRGYLLDLSKERGLDHDELVHVFAHTYKQPSIIERISRPAEKRLNWGEYRAIFLGTERITEGMAFYKEHQTLLERAESVYGVPASVITAIIGVETFYGRHDGEYRVIEALATLAFDYPPRASFFQSELGEFLSLSETEGWDAREPLGSYAGAMGLPQFISSSYHEYAVDFDGDGERDLFGSVADAIGSVANYLSRHGWQKGAPIAVEWVPPTANRDAARALVRESLMPEVTAAELEALGFEGELPGSGRLADASGRNALMSVMALQHGDVEEIWVAYHNFYVITRYNHSHLYALAVAQLADMIDDTTLTGWHGEAAN